MAAIDDKSIQTAIRMLTFAAEQAGVDEDGNKAGYSLHWWFRSCLPYLLDSNSKLFSPLVAAYLGATDELPAPATDEGATAAWMREQLATGFPGDAHDHHHLNDSQTEATFHALSDPLSVIDGPPGTGKTATICHIVALALARGETVAVVSPNGAAVDNVCDKLGKAHNATDDPAVPDLMRDAGDRLIRLGCNRIRKAIANPTNEHSAFIPGDHSLPDGSVEGGWEQNITLSELAERTPLVASTVHSLPKCTADDLARYDMVIMDEASQASLVVGLVAMGCARRLVLVGDPKQLPPVVPDQLSHTIASWEKKNAPSLSGSPLDASRQDLSFIESVTGVFGDSVPVTLLNCHYRCHPKIIGFCNHCVYDNKLRVRTPVSPDSNPLPIRVLYYRNDYREGRWLRGRDGTYSHSAVNDRQLAIFQHVELPRIRKAVEADKSLSFCIISPFRAQVRAIQSILSEQDWLSTDDLSQGLSAHKANATPDEPPERGADEEHALTIHRSQGREFDIVYLLPVEDGQWEWPWSQGERLVNVAVSRAKKELVVITSTTLMDNDTVKRLDSMEGRPHKALGRRGPSPQRAREKGELFVQQLCSYVLSEQLSIEAEGGTVPSGYGMVPTPLGSILDTADAYGPHTVDDSNLESRIDYTLHNLTKSRSCEGLGIKPQLRFNHLFVGDTCLAQIAAKKGYKEPTEAHFDFVVYELGSKDVVALIEVDGLHHRDLHADKSGQPDITVWEYDRMKDRLATQDCHALAVRLGLPWLISKMPGSDKMPDGTDWHTPEKAIECGLGPIYVRFACDGSTYCETRYLREAAQEAFGSKRLPDGEPFPPTLCELLLSARRGVDHNRADRLRVVLP
jgi:RecA/RadA recombinase